MYASTPIAFWRVDFLSLWLSGYQTLMFNGRDRRGNVTGEATMKVLGLVVALAFIAPPAMALTSTNGPLWPDCADVRLQQAAGVPGKGDHSYQLAGTCKHISTHYVDGKKEGATEHGRAFLKVNAVWDASKNELKESATLSGEEGGSLNTIFNCSDDPYIAPTTCTVVAHVNGTQWPDLSHSAIQKQHPLGAGWTTLEEASAISTAWNDSPPPPPPPPGAGATPPPQTITGKSFRKVKPGRKNGPVVYGGVQPSEAPLSRNGMAVGQHAPMGRITPATANLVKGATSTGPAPTKQDMTRFGPGWDGGDQLFWRAGKVGQKLQLQVNAATSGKYHVVASFTKAPDYGIVQAFLNGQALGDVVNLYSKTVSLTGPRVLGTVSVKAGQNSLVFWAIGKDQRSRGHFVGLDEVELIPVP
jgi:hypothetical protein